MRPIVTDGVAWCVGRSVGLSVCLCVTLISPAKRAAPIEVPFGLRTRVGPTNHVLDGVQNPDPHRNEVSNFVGGRVYRTLCSELFKNGLRNSDAVGLWARMGPKGPDPRGKEQL